MKRKNLRSLKLNKKSISKLDHTKGGIVPPPPPTLEKTCNGPVGHAVCATFKCETEFWCGPSNHPTCFETQDCIIEF